MAKSFLFSVIVVFCAALIECAILSNLYILPVVPDLVLVCCVYFSLANGKIYGECAGAVSGLFLDFLTGVPFGLNCIFRTILGYLYGILREKGINILRIVTPIITVSTATILKHIFIWIISFFYTAKINPTNLISKDFLFEFMANTVLAPLIFAFLGCFKKSISMNKKEDFLEDA